MKCLKHQFYSLDPCECPGCKDEQELVTLRARVAELEEAIRIALANLEDDPNYPVTINTLELALKP